MGWDGKEHDGLAWENRGFGQGAFVTDFGIRD
jgi:hypothetical protein